MQTGRVILRAERDGNTFEWILDAELVDPLAGHLREKGWNVTVEPEPPTPDSDEAVGTGPVDQREVSEERLQGGDGGVAR